jgi:putative ABC transport system permease protein
MMSAQTSTNNLKDFKIFLEENGSNILDYTNAIQYKYKMDINIYNNNANSTSYVKTSPNQIMEKLGMGQMQEMQSMMYGNAFGSYEIWEEMLDNDELLKSQYDLLAGKWPEKFNEVVLIVDEDTKVSDYTLYSLGLLDPDELTEKYKKLMKGEEVEEIEKQTYTYDDILDLKFKVVLNTDYYKKERKHVERYAGKMKNT